jgi:hypothetical protein
MDLQRCLKKILQDKVQKELIREEAEVGKDKRLEITNDWFGMDVLT